ncbi:MAG: ABC transporter permease subunit [Mesorhizobium sp.]
MTVDPVNWPGLQKPGPFLKLRAWLGPRPLLQIGLLSVFALVAILLGTAISANMTRIGITPGFGFLSRSANFEIGEQTIAFRAGDTYLRALAVGFLNTGKVAALGCVLATALGVAIAIAGLSGNLLLAGLVRSYIEIIRNTPLLLQLFFWISLVQSLPPPRRAFSVLDAFYLSNRGVFLPGFTAVGGSQWTWIASLACLAIAMGLAVFLRRRDTSNRMPAITALIALAIAALVLFAGGARVELSVPQLSGFNIRGGYSLTPEFAALLTGLVVKFSASIAEIVRAGILSVKPGQWEAGRALGLSNAQIVRLIVLPQAMRVITPLTTSNYLDLTKDSSLAVAIGYPDLVNIVNTTANTTGQAFEALIILVIVYVTLNIGVSLAMNAYNARVALKGGRPA